MKIYTKTGDSGETGLFGGTRVSKGSLRVETYGEVDELNAALGCARAAAGGHGGELDEWLAMIQETLFRVGAELASNPTRDVDLGVDRIDDGDIHALEQIIDTLDARLPALKTFILPGGTVFAAELHLARTICRRAERALVRLGHEDPVRRELIVYLNRLSDLLFVVARAANARAGVADVPWLGRRSSY